MKDSNDPQDADAPEGSDDPQDRADLDPDTTIEEINELDPDATIEESDLDATIDDPNATVLEDDPYATVSEEDLAKTVVEDDPNQTVVEEDTSKTVIEDDTDKTVIEDDQDRTVAEDELDQTIEEITNDATVLEETIEFNTVVPSNLDETVETIADASAHRAGKEDSGTESSGTENSDEEDSDEEDADEEDAGDDHPTSTLDSANLTRTINPDSLSPAESEYWNSISAEFASPREATFASPAIDRTIVETRLQLRDQIVATKLQDQDDSADYRLVRLLGRGGMGNVFVARQGSLDRLIAVKVIRPLDTAKKEKLAAQGKLEKVEQGRRQQFLTEAVVTGDLDHPNIVPIHDVAVTGDSTLFYSMKRVVGTPWSDVIDEKSRDENLEILVKVADAIGFAHTRGVVHRDIKPENVMLGDFGVVMVMDWGIALAKPEFEKLDSITPATGLGGTPSMMAPEMAIGPIESIGPPADIYLLGATLFMIVTGKPPHHAGNVSQCLRAVASNQIRDFDPKHQGELMNIALKAMASRPEDRYADVKAFQDAIRDYRSHSESIALAMRAEEDRQAANEHKSYTSFARAQFGFEEALSLWPGNEAAKTGLHQTRIDHAEAAYQNADYEVGLSLLSADEPDHADLLTRLGEALRLRRQREARFGLLKKVAAALLAFIFIGGSVAYYWIDQAKTLAETNADLASEQTKIAQRQERIAREEKNRADENAAIALSNEKEAGTQRRKAEENAALAVSNANVAKENERKAQANAKRAERNADEARVAQSRAEYESYVSKIGLAKARIDRNEFSEARRLLSELSGVVKTKNAKASLPWEIRYLKSLANQATTTVQTESPVVELAVSKPLPFSGPESNSKPANSRNSQVGLVRFETGTVALVRINAVTQEVMVSQPRRVNGGTASAIAVNDDGTRVVIGTINGNIEVHRLSEFSKPAPDAQPNKTLIGHRDEVTGLQFTQNGLLVSSSIDRTLRIWDPKQEAPLRTCWHIAPVVDVAAVVTNPDREDSPLLIAAAVGRRSTGQVVLWKAERGSEMTAQRQGVFDEHQTGLTCVSFSPNGQTVASGDSSGEVLVWPTSSVKRRDTEGLIQRAVQTVAKGPAPQVAPSAERSGYALNPETRLLKNEQASKRDEGTFPAHEDSVRSLQFASDGRSILSSGDDYVISIWQETASASNPWRQSRRLLGHGGPVRDAIFLDGDRQQVVSAGIDQSVRMWTARSRSRSQGKPDSPMPSGANGAHFRQVHQDQIWSAAISRDGRKLVTASRDRTAKLLAIDPKGPTLETTSSLRLDTDGQVDDLSEGSLFRAMTMRTDAAGKFLLVGGADSIVRIWNIDRGTEAAQINGTGLNQTLAVSSDGRTILTGASEPDVRAVVWKWDPESLNLDRVHRLAVHEETVASMAIDQNAKRAVTGDRAGRIVLWDLSTGKPIGPPIDLLLGMRINDIAFDASGNHIWVAADDERLSKIDLRSREIRDRLDHQGFVTKVRLTDDGRFALTTSELQKTDRTIHLATLWQLSADPDDLSLREDYRSQTLASMAVPINAQTVDGGRPGIESIDFDSKSSQAIVSLTPAGESGGRVEVWNVNGGVDLAKKRLAFALPARIGAVSEIISLPFGDLVSLHGSSAYRWNLKNGKLDRSYRSHGAITTSAFSNDGNLVATGSRSIKIWNSQNGNSIGKLESPHEGVVRCLAFLPKTNKTFGAKHVFFTGGDDGVVHSFRFDPETAQFEPLELVTKRKDTAAVLSVSLSPDGNQLVSTTAGGQVILNEVGGEASRVLLDEAAVGRVTASAFSSDGRFVAAAGDDRMVRVWKLADDQVVLCQGHAETVESLAFEGSEEAGNLRLFSASQDRSIRVWDPSAATTPNQGRELLELVGHEDGVTSIDLNPSGSLLISAGRDGRVVLWSATP